MDFRIILAGIVVAALTWTTATLVGQGDAIGQLQATNARLEATIGRLEATIDGLHGVSEDGEATLPATVTPTLAELTDSVPAGVIAMWSGSLDSLPAGWALCDGDNGTPDLRERFILGSGRLGLEKDLTGGGQLVLTSGNLPAHSHVITHGHGHTLSVDPASHAHGYSRPRSDIVGRLYERLKLASGRDAGLWTGDEVTTDGAELAITGRVEEHVGFSEDAGRIHPIPLDIVPRYYRLAFIMRVR